MESLDTMIQDSSISACSCCDVWHIQLHCPPFSHSDGLLMSVDSFFTYIAITLSLLSSIHYHWIASRVISYLACYHLNAFLWWHLTIDNIQTYLTTVIDSFIAFSCQMQWLTTYLWWTTIPISWSLSKLDLPSVGPSQTEHVPSIPPLCAMTVSRWIWLQHKFSILLIPKKNNFC